MTDPATVTVPGQRSGLFRKEHLVTFAKYCPLATAILAPLSTLMDIPALTQRWYTFNDVHQPDPIASLVLSAVGLVLNVIANILLVLRFSSKSRKWIKHTVHWSLGCWTAKTVIAAVNLIVFGIYHRRGGDEGFVYAEGFWCAVVSICVAGLITLALLLHFFLAFNKPEEDTVAVRKSGRKFMISITIFMSIIALQALVFSRLEHWSYSDGIYFSVQTAFTIGYGDLTPNTTTTKVLIFPFAVLTISQLGNEISLIVAFIRERSKERRRVWRKQYEGAIHQEARLVRPKATLLEEMTLVHDINQREEWVSQIIDLFWSGISLVTFWLLGALIFSSIEGWTYGDGVYAVIVTSLTIGFGDFTPVTAAGRVVWIPFALLAVPIVTSFAVQTITGLLSTFSNRGHTTEELRDMSENGSDSCRPHAELLDTHRQALARVGSATSYKSSRELPLTEEANAQNEVDAAEEKQAELIRRLMESVTKLEDHARRLLLDHLDHGLARTLLVADRNLQDPNVQPSVRGTKDLSPADRTDSTMEDVETYRSLFAEVLVLGSTVQGLKGDDLAKFERRISTQLPATATGQARTTTSDGVVMEKSGTETGVEDSDRSRGQTVDGLKGLSRVMYRQHAKKLQRTYSVA